MVEADIDVSKGQARPRPASRLPLSLYSWLPQWSSCSKQLKALPFDQAPVVAIEGTSPQSSHHQRIPGLALILRESSLRASKAPQLEAHTRSLDNGRRVP